ncbi:MAG: hypothetical protein R3B69_03640 [Candidatus Paceibacterota bacterium]
MVLTTAFLIGICLLLPWWVRTSPWFWGAVLVFGSSALAKPLGASWSPVAIKFAGVLVLVAAVANTFGGVLNLAGTGAKKINEVAQATAECLDTGDCITVYEHGDVAGITARNPTETAELRGEVKVIVPVGYFPYTSQKTRLTKDLGHTAWFAPCGSTPIVTQLSLVKIGVVVKDGGSC